MTNGSGSEHVSDNQGDLAARLAAVEQRAEAAEEANLELQLAGNALSALFSNSLQSFGQLKAHEIATGPAVSPTEVTTNYYQDGTQLCTLTIAPHAATIEELGDAIRIVLNSTDTTPGAVVTAGLRHVWAYSPTSNEQAYLAGVSPLSIVSLAYRLEAARRLRVNTSTVNALDAVKRAIEVFNSRNKA